MAKRMLDFVAFDTETTGIKASEDRVVELGAVRFQNGQPMASFSRLVNPGIPIPPEASAVNHITDSAVRGQPPISDILQDFADYCGDLPLVAHNAPFDYKFLHTEITQCSGPAPTGPILDTLGLAKVLLPGLPDLRLDTIARRLRLPPAGAHRAAQDAIACGRVFIELYRILEKNNEPREPEDIQVLSGKKPMFLPQIKRPSGQQLDLFG